MTQHTAAAPPSPRSPAGEEELRFIRNFHDVFLSIGLAMFAAGLGVVSSLLLQEALKGFEAGNWRPVTIASGSVALADAVIIWALAELFARRRRLFLPAIVLLLAFLSFWTIALGCAYALWALNGDLSQLEKPMEEIGDRLKTLPLFMAGGGTLGIFAYYLRMRLPFAMGLGAMGLAATAIAALHFRDPQLVMTHARTLALGAGLGMFLLGVIYDARDPERATRYADNGFWLHFFAAPLIFLSVTALTIGEAGLARGDPRAAATTLLIVGAFALVSLLINRRALLVSGLLSAIGAVAALISKAGLDAAWTAGGTLFLLGGAMVLLGGGWRAARRALTAPFPKRGWISRIIPPEPPAGRDGE